MSSASSSARWIACTVVSMFTTTPFLRPREGWLPMPMISKPPSGRISATIAAILEVPMSSPTIRFLLSLALPMRFRSLLSGAPRAPRLRLFLAQLGDAHGEPVGVAQVDVIDAAPENGGGTLVRGHEAGKPRLD